MTSGPQDEEDMNVLWDDIARRSQRLLSDQPAVILGTGASIPHGLPSMRELADALLASVDSPPTGWQRLTDQLNDGNDLETALHNVSLPPDTVEFLIRATWDIVSARDIEFYNTLLTGDTDFPLSDLFRFLLRTANSHLLVVTTNYDRLAEYAANRAGAYASTGLTPGWLQRFAPTAVSTRPRSSPGLEGTVSILKVHGSLDWFRDSTDDVVGIPLAHTTPSGLMPLVVTPGISKYREVHKDPFRTIMSSADDGLRSANAYICIGYGFNDEHVQPVLVNRVFKDHVPLVILAKQLSPQVHNAFLNDRTPKHFLFLEESSHGTIAYTPDYPAGKTVDGSALWRLSHFLKLAQGETPEEV